MPEGQIHLSPLITHLGVCPSCKDTNNLTANLERVPFSQSGHIDRMTDTLSTFNLYDSLSLDSPCPCVGYDGHLVRGAMLMPFKGRELCTHVPFFLPTITEPLSCTQFNGFALSERLTCFILTVKSAGFTCSVGTQPASIKVDYSRSTANSRDPRPYRWPS